MTDRTPALEWTEHQRYSSLGAREDCYYTVEIGDFWMRVELDDSASGPEYWRWEFCDEVAFGYAPTHTAAQLAAEDFLRAQRDALGVLGTDRRNVSSERGEWVFVPEYVRQRIESEIKRRSYMGGFRRRKEAP